MTIEEKIFQRKRIAIDHGSVFEADLIGGDFHAIVTVADDGKVTGKVIDNMNNEEYAPLRSEGFNGAYVNSVRAAYEAFLLDVAGKCFKDVLFASDQANRIAGQILDLYSVEPDFPWGRDPYQCYATFRHPENRKWFGLIMNIKWDSLLNNGSKETVDVINLKVDPAKADSTLTVPGVFPAYHMNHKSWISVVLNDSLTDANVMNLVDSSFVLTK